MPRITYFRTFQIALQTFLFGHSRHVSNDVRLATGGLIDEAHFKGTLNSD